MNGAYNRLPSGPAQQAYYPDDNTFMATASSSAHSEDSFVSQMPLPYHMSNEGPFAGSFMDTPQQHYALPGYQQNPQIPFHTFHQTENFSPQQGMPGQTMETANDYTQQDNGYVQQPNSAQGYRPVQSQIDTQLPHAQIGGYQIGQYQPQMLGYPLTGPQHPSHMTQTQPQHSQNQQHIGQFQQVNHNPDPYNTDRQSHFGRASANLQGQRPGPSYIPSEHQQRQYQIQNSMSSGYPQGQGHFGQSQFAMDYGGRGQRLPHGMQGRSGPNQDRSFSRASGDSQPDYTTPVFSGAPPLSMRVGISALTGAAPNYIPAGNDQTPSSVTSNFSGGSNSATSSSNHTSRVSLDQGKSDVVLSKSDGDAEKTPMKTIASAASLPQRQDSRARVLRSRRQQSIGVSTFRIDPVRGPPPAFWPKNFNPAENSLTSPVEQVFTGSANEQFPEYSGQDNSKENEAGPFNDISMMGQDLPHPSAEIMSPQPPKRRVTLRNDIVPNDLYKALRPTASGPPVLAQKMTAAGPSSHLTAIAVNGKVPSVEVAFDRANMPFVTSALEYSGPSNTGVVRISNIPYSVTRSEIVAFLGRNARIINEQDEPVHIIMERVTSKTMDAYVEFVNIQEAVSSVNRYDTNRAGGRGGRLGERHVELEVVGHERLMHDLFPKAKNVRWNGAVPVIQPTDPDDPYNSGFQGFISSEELVMLVKHVETPQRSPFSRECPQRPYECLISTLVKFPWYMIDYITLEDRTKLYDATEKLVKFLCNRLQEGEEHNSIDNRLLRRVQRAIFQGAAFTECQKDNLAFAIGMTTAEAGLVPCARHWWVWKTIGPKRGIEPDVLLYYESLIREATESDSLAERYANTSTHSGPNIFGEPKIEFPEDCEKMSFAAVAKIEWAVIEKLIRKRIAMGNIN